MTEWVQVRCDGFQQYASGMKTNVTANSPQVSTTNDKEITDLQFVCVTRHP